MKGWTLLVFITLQRGLELALATRNTKALRRRGAYEVGARHYPVMVALHATWLTSLWLHGRRRNVFLPLLAVFLGLQTLRLWVLLTLRERWTTRIIILPEAAPIVRGPYRFVRHPNYLVVALELPCVALALGLRRHAVCFGLANLAMLAWRIRSEERAFGRAAAPSEDPKQP
jgi:methyltransferase